jgi:hypothetical protein
MHSSLFRVLTCSIGVPVISKSISRWNAQYFLQPPPAPIHTFGQNMFSIMDIDWL